MASFLVRFKMQKRTAIIIAVAVVAIGIYYVHARSGGGTYQFVTVKRGPITETVSVTGNTTPAKSLTLAFENGGTIVAVNEDVGTLVRPGDVIARLDTSDLSAQLREAKANVDAEQAKLTSLQTGAQPADIDASRAAVAKAQQDLANMYASVPNTITDAEAKSNDAVRNQIAPFFSSAETNNVQLTFSVNDSQVSNDAVFHRITASSELNAWQSEVQAPSLGTPSSTLDTTLTKAAGHLAMIRTLITSASQALLAETGLSATTVDAYHAAIIAAQNEVNTATANVNSAAQSIASQKITITQLSAQLALKIAGATASDIAAQKAQVEQAQANAESIQVKIAKAALVSPITGVITVQNAKVGQIAAPGAVLVSLISNGNLEIDANVPETDIGKVAIGNAVKITFDAFPNETFTGKVFYIDPAETVIQGVVDYKIKISLDKPDPRIKSGLTANLDIETRKEDATLVLPQFAILQNDKGSFVEVLTNGSMEQVPVTLGIRDDAGNVEVASGVTEGEQVLNIGLKQGTQ